MSSQLYGCPYSFPSSPSSPSFPVSSRSLTVMYPDWFPSTDAFEKSLGFLKNLWELSEWPPFRDGSTAFRVSIGLDGLQRMGAVVICVMVSGGMRVWGWCERWEPCLFFISQTMFSIFVGCWWPDRSYSELDEGIVRLSTVQSRPRTALNNLL